MGFLAFGVKVKRGDGATPEVFTEVAELTGLSGPEISVDAVEVTHTSSPSAARQYIAGLLDAGEVGLEVNWLPADITQNDSATGLLGDIVARTLRNFQIVWPDTAGTTWQVSAVPTNLSPDAGDLGGKMTAGCTLKVSGLPDFSV